MINADITEDQAFCFGGIARLYGERALNGFLRSHVVVVGIGGVGSWAAEALARSGVGEVMLIDLDDVCVSNINRQVLALQTSVGQIMKVDVMAERLKQINPAIKVHTEHAFLGPEHIAELLPLRLPFTRVTNTKYKCKNIGPPPKKSQFSQTKC